MENNKKIMLGVGAVVLAVLAFVVGSSSSNDSSTPAPKPQPTNTWTPEPEVPSYSSEDEYLWALSDMNNDIIDYSSDSDLLDMGWAVCDVLDDGYDLNDIIDYFVYESDFSTEEEFEALGIVVGGAVVYLCPEYSYMIDDVGTTY